MFLSKSIRRCQKRNGSSRIAKRFESRPVNLHCADVPVSMISTMYLGFDFADAHLCLEPEKTQGKQSKNLYIDRQEESTIPDLSCSSEERSNLT